MFKKMKEKKTTSADEVEAPECSTRSVTQHIRSSAPALTERERWMAGRERQTERKVRETLPTDPSPHTDAVVPLHGREVSPAPSLPRMLMQPPLPGNRLMGVAQGLGTRNV